MTIKQLRLLEKSAIKEQQLIQELNGLAKDIERCEKTLAALQTEISDLNSKFQGPRNTQQDIAYLSGLLECARKKLVWEKQVGSIRKRAPVILQEMTALLENPLTAPAEETRAKMLDPLQKVQAALERFQAANV